MFKHKFLVLSILILSILTIYQFLPTLYFPYISNDSLWELWKTDIQMYYDWAIYQGRPFRHLLVLAGTYIVNNSIAGLFLLRYMSLVIYIVNTILLFFIIYKFIKPNLVFSLLFMLFFNSLQSSQIQLAWADVAIHQILYTVIYSLAYILLNSLSKYNYINNRLYFVVFLTTLIINLFYPIAPLMLVSILSGYLLFQFNTIKHLKAFLILGICLLTSLIATKLTAELIIKVNETVYVNSYFNSQGDFIRNLNIASFIRDTVFGALLFGDNFSVKSKVIFNMIMLFIGITIVVFYDKSKKSYIKYTLFGLALLLCSVGNVLKAYYTLRTIYPVSMALLFFLFYAVSLLCSSTKFKNYKKFLTILFTSLAFYFMIASNFSLMRGFVYPRLKEMDYYRYKLISKNIEKGDTIVVVRPLSSNESVYSPISGWIEFDVAYTSWNKVASPYLANFYMKTIGLNDSDYNFLYIDLAKDVAIPNEYKDMLVIDLRLFTLAESKHAKYIFASGQDILLR